MLKRTLMTAVSGAALIAATNAQAFIEYDVEAIQDESYVGTTFNQNLAREYKDFATFEAYEMYDWIDAEHFAEKAVAASNGATVKPEAVADWNIPEEHISDLMAGKALLTTALANGARTAAPAEAAKAQAKYDCWMEQQEEDHQPSHIAACRADFYAAMEALNAKMKPKQVTTTETVVSPVSKQAAVFFQFDRATITPQAEAKIDAFVNQFEDKKSIELRVTGHADTSGPADYNRALSRDRAQAVIAELRAHGMNVADLKDVDIIAKGESAPIVKTGDGVRERANRRVEIYAYGQQPITVNVTKQVGQLER